MNHLQILIDECARVTEEMRRNSTRKYRKDQEACDGMVSVRRDVLDFLFKEYAAAGLGLLEKDLGVSRKVQGELSLWRSAPDENPGETIKLPVGFIQKLIDGINSVPAKFTAEELSAPRQCLHIRMTGEPQFGCVDCQKYMERKSNKKQNKHDIHLTTNRYVRPGTYVAEKARSDFWAENLQLKCGDTVLRFIGIVEERKGIVAVVVNIKKSGDKSLVTELEPIKDQGKECFLAREDWGTHAKVVITEMDFGESALGHLRISLEFEKRSPFRVPTNEKKPEAKEDLGGALDRLRRMLGDAKDGKPIWIEAYSSPYGMMGAHYRKVHSLADILVDYIMDSGKHVFQLECDASFEKINIGLRRVLRLPDYSLQIICTVEDMSVGQRFIIDTIDKYDKDEHAPAENIDKKDKKEA